MAKRKQKTTKTNPAPKPIVGALLVHDSLTDEYVFTDVDGTTFVFDKYVMAKLTPNEQRLLRGCDVDAARVLAAMLPARMDVDNAFASA